MEDCVVLEVTGLCDLAIGISTDGHRRCRFPIQVDTLDDHKRHDLGSPTLPGKRNVFACRE